MQIPLLKGSDIHRMVLYLRKRDKFRKIAEELAAYTSCFDSENSLEIKNFAGLRPIAGASPRSPWEWGSLRRSPDPTAVFLMQIPLLKGSDIHRTVLYLRKRDKFRKIAEELAAYASRFDSENSLEIKNFAGLRAHLRPGAPGSGGAYDALQTL